MEDKNFRNELRVVMDKGYNSRDLFEAIDELQEKYETLQKQETEKQQQVNDAKTEKEKCTLHCVSHLLPTELKAGTIAVDISEKVKPEITAQEQAFFIAGFQECIKYLKNIDCNNG